MTSELTALLRNRMWRLDNLYWIQDKSGNYVRFTMNWAQRELMENLHTRNNVLKVRQLGISTLMALVMLDACLFTGGYRAGIVDKKLDEAQLKIEKMALAYRMLSHVPEGATAREQGLAEIGRMIQGQVPIESETQGRIVWRNGSSVRASTSMRGGTLQFLHISELGYVAAHAPLRAREIVTGATNAVSKDGVIVMESTHEGGHWGLNYQMTRSAMEMTGKALSPLDYKFFFFPWWRHPEYSLPGTGYAPDQELNKYFDSLQKTLGIVLSNEQKAWYASHYRTDGAMVRQEYPSVPEEAFETQVEGSIYGEKIDKARYEGRYNLDFIADPYAPLYVSMDIGMSDNTSMWLIQAASGHPGVLDHFSFHGKAMSFYMDQIRVWERAHGKIEAVVLPHDANKRNPVGGPTVAQYFREAGWRVIVVPRVPDVWVGINSTRELIDACYFHERCTRKTCIDGIEMPSGLNCLESYQTAPEGSNGAMHSQPLHDLYSHSADAFRTFAEAVLHGLIGKTITQRRTAFGNQWGSRVARGTLEDA